jgi:hypothetical protein
VVRFELEDLPWTRPVGQYLLYWVSKAQLEEILLE